MAQGWWRNQDNGNPVGAGYTGGFAPPGNTVTFVDGGILSNFPIAEFHTTTSVPLCPTFGEAPDKLSGQLSPAPAG